MKKVLVSLCIVGSALMLGSCTVTETTYGTGYYGTGYSTAYVATTGVYTAPVYGGYGYGGYGYGGYGYGYDSNWYAGTPDYYDTSVYVSDW